MIEYKQGDALRKMITKEKDKCLRILERNKKISYVEDKTIWVERVSENTFKWGYIGNKDNYFTFVIFCI